MKIQIRVQRLLAALGASVLPFFVAVSVSAQQTNPNNIPLCPPMSENFLGFKEEERISKWHNCWGEIGSRREKYVEEFVNGKFHGFGTWTARFDLRYVGEFKFGRFHGKGIQIFTTH